MNIRQLLLFFSLFGLSAACSTTINRQMEQTSVEEFDSLQTVYYHLSDSLNWAFQTMMQDDNQKIANMKRLLDEIRKSGHERVDTLDSLNLALEKLQSIRYDSVSMADNDKVVQYDSMAYTISEAVIQYAEQQPDFYDNPVMTVLIDQIEDANNSILLYRLQYDRLSQEFNQFLEEYRSLIATMDNTGAPVQKRPVFKFVNEYEEKEK